MNNRIKMNLQMFADPVDLKSILGDDLFSQVTAKLGDKHKVALVSDGNWIPKEKFNEANEAKKKLEKDVADRDKQLEDLSKTTGASEELKKEIERLQGENKTAKQKYESELKDIRVSAAIEKALQGANAKYPDLLLGKINKEKIELLEDGAVKGLEDQIKSLKESYKDQFGDGKTTPSGITPHGGGGAAGGNDSPELSKLNEDLKKAIESRNLPLQISIKKQIHAAQTAEKG